MSPKAEKILKKESAKHLAFSSFLSLGAACLAVGINVGMENVLSRTLLALPVSFFLGYVALGGFITSLFNFNKLHNKKRVFPFYDTLPSKWDKMYKKEMTQYLKRELNSCSSLLEKKYKVIFLQEFLDTNYTHLDKFLENKKIINDLSKELIENNISKHNLADFTKKESNFYFKDFLDEDWQDENKQLIIRNVYKEYQNCGMLGAQFKWSIIRIVPYLKIQNEINKSDIPKINAVANEKETLYINTQIINQLQNNQKGEEELDALINLFENKHFVVSDTINKDWKEEKEEIIHAFKARKNYVMMDEKLEEKMPVKVKRTKI